MVNNQDHPEIALAAKQKIREKDYWLNKLSGESIKSYFPPDYPTNENEPRTETIKYRLPPGCLSSLINVTGASDLKMHIIMTAGVVGLLHKYTGNNDITIGTPIYKQDIEGDFINRVLILRNYIKEDMTFKELLLEMKQTLIEAIENRNYPVEILAKQLNHSFSPGDDFPLFDVTISVENIQDKKYLQHLRTNTGFSFFRTDKYIEGIVEYNAGIYKETTIRRIIHHFKRLVREVLINLELKISQIDVLSPQEKTQVLFDFNDTKTEYPSNKTIQQLFRDQVECTPDHMALIGEIPNCKSQIPNAFSRMHLSYRELNQRANQLAGLLIEKGVKADTIAGIMVERSIEMIIGILGILKSGGAYLPIDPEYPEERINYMLDDSSARVLVTTPKLQVKVKTEVEENFRKMQPLPLQLINLESKFESVFEPSTSTLTSTSTCQVSPANLAYIIYTSGSTGKPKGVLTAHYNVTRIARKTNYIDLTKQDRVLQLSNYAFDGSVFDIYGALLNGAVLVILPAARPSIQQLAKFIKKDQITVFFVTTALFNLLVDESPYIFNNIRKVLFGGERVSVEHARKALEYSGEGKIIHMYGPTETTVYATFFDINVIEENISTIPIGNPLSNTTIYILDHHLKLVPLGAVGEMYIGGCGTSRGYLNRQELTAEKFIPSPFVQGDRLYKTGDLAKWLPDGNIEFIERIDDQVKIRGFRIEVGEIENQLLKHEEIKKALVIINEDKQLAKYLCAYVVPNSPHFSYSPNTLREYLSRHLPDYMIPSYIMQIEKIPLTTNGKIDRKALPMPEILSDSEYAAPRNTVEETLVQLWSEVLNLDIQFIGIDDDFFQLGGHSLKATILVSKIQKALNIQIPLAEIFRTPTIRELAQYVTTAPEIRYTSIEAVEKREYYAPSSAQSRLYILQQMELNSTAYNIPEVIPLKVEPAVEKLEKTFIQLVERHESLRTSFHMVVDELQQKVHDTVEFKVEYYERGIHSSSVIRQRFDSAFDLKSAPLLKVGVVKIEKGKYVLVVVMHHIISDGLSIDIFAKEFMALYKGNALSPLRIQYKDFSQWQNSRKEKEKLKQQEAYWLKEFAGEIPVLNIPTDYPRPIIQSFEGSAVSFEIGGIETQLLNTNAREDGVTLFMLLLTITNIWLAKVSNQEDIVLGTPIAGRRHADLDKIIGMFVNTLALRNYPGGEKNFKNFLIEIKQNTLEAFENQEYQFEDLVEKVAVHRDASRNPLFDVMYAFQTPDRSTNDKSKEKPPGNQVREKKQSDAKQLNDGDQYGTAKFDLTLNGTKAGEKLLFTIQYSTKLFKKETIQRFVTYFKKIVSTVTNDPGIPLGKIDILSEKERNQLLYDFNNTAREYPQNKTLRQLFEEQVDRNPDNAAVIFHDRKLTYKELNRKSDQLAEVLREKGVLGDTVVGIMMERSIEMIIAILGILKTGGAYLPLDPDYPQERVDFMLKDSSARVLVTTPKLQVKVKTEVEENFRKMQPLPLKLINLETKLESVFEPSPLTLTSISTCQVSPANLAYIIYTSGSTGNPRGVMVEHVSVINLAFCQIRQFQITAQDRVLQFSSISFDASVEQIFISLYSGAGLVLVDKDTLFDKKKFEELLFNHLITHIHAVPSFLKTINVPGNYHLKRMIAGGDICSSSLAKEWHHICDFYNEYGPTETTVTSIEYLVKRPDNWNVQLPIGKALDNTTVFILDRWYHPVPYRTVGELYIGGDGVARGYLNNPELTAEKFDHDSWDLLDYRDYKKNNKKLLRGRPDASRGGFLEKSPPGRRRQNLYKTGDLAKWLSDGNIEFLGRIDHQVKIRGFRIEPGEIESHLLKHKEIKDVIVVARDDNDENKNLCAYIVAQPEAHGAWRKELKEFLSKTLPDHMIPAYFIPIEKIPLTPSGKIDRRGLPAPMFQSSSPFAPPRDEIEEKLTKIWTEVLKAPISIGIDDNFFDLGGHSLKALVLVSKIHKELNVRVPLAELFKTPVVRGMAEYIKQAEKEVFSAIEPVEKKEYYTLSSAQKRLYILQHMDMESTVYNMPEIIPLTGEPESEKFEDTFIQLIKGHESLRTSFHMFHEQPVQKVHEKVEFAIEYFEFKAGFEDEIIHHFDSPFDLTQAPLLKAGIIRQPDDTYLLVVVMHHIVSDGASHEILIKDFTAHYRKDQLPPLRIQYKDFSVWQNKKKQKEALKKQETYWLKEFEAEIPILEIPTDYPRPRVQRFEGNTLSFRILAGDTSRLKILALKHQVTLYMVLLAALNVLLSKLSGQEDIIIGTPVIGRRHADLEPIIGMFVNTLALRNYPQNEKTFREFLFEVRHRTLHAFESQEYPFEDLVEKVSIIRNAGRNPLFDVMYTLQTASAADGTDYQKKEETQPQSTAPNIRQTSKFDITFNGAESGNQLLFAAEYSTKLFKQQTIQRFITYFKAIISAIAKKPDIRLRDIEIISREEKQQILCDFNDTITMYPGDKTIQQLFGELVERDADHTALVGREEGGKRSRVEGNSKMHLSYRQLNEKSNQLACLLKDKGVGPDTIVGIMVKRSIEMIVGILGILKAGGAYLPIVPEYPEERIDFMLKDSSVRVLVTTPKLQVKVKTEVEENFRKMQPLSLQLINLETKLESVFEPSPSTLTSTCQVSPANLAYIIYTSGSTGNPKGVLTTHYNVTRVVRNTNYIELEAGDRILQLSNYAFDGSVFDIYGALLNSSTLVLPEARKAAAVSQLIEIIEKEKITVFFVTTALFNLLVDERPGIFEKVKKVLFGGEQVSIKHTQRILEYIGKHKIIHVYGPTETTVYATYYFVDRINENADTIPIGSPLANTFIYLLDKYLQLIPVEVVGELYIGGYGTARGYLNQPELTAEKFIPNPFTKKDRLYRTGDLGRWLPNGNIEFSGRIDYQVKIRGFRVEPGEIETQLRNHQDIKDAVVITIETTPTDGSNSQKDKYLCAYITPENEKDLPTIQIKEFLTRQLPDYMIPAYFVQVEKIPLTPNGKVNRKALPSPVVKYDREYTAPRSSVEKILVRLWGEVLSPAPLPRPIGIDDDFFQLGGHSLKATILITKMHKELNVKMPLTEIFNTPTIRGLAQYIRDAAEDKFALIESSEKKEYYVLSTAQKRLYILQQMIPENIVYNMPQVIQLEKAPDIVRFESTFKKLIERHKSLRTSFHIVSNQPVQKVHDHVDFEIEYKEVEVKVEEGDNEETRGLAPLHIISSFIYPFDLSRPPLLRVGLIKLLHTPSALRSHPSQEGKKTKYLLIIDMHHIISDGISNTILMRNFTALDRKEVLPPLRIHYEDFSRWQNSPGERERLQEQEEYWQSIYEDQIPVLNIPTDYPRPAIQNFEGTTISFEIDSNVTELLKKLATEEGVTLYMLLLALCNIWLEKLSNQEDIVIGSPVAGRRHADLEQIIGMFVNTLALRHFPVEEKPFNAFLKEVKVRTLQAFENQEYPFEELVDRLKIARDTGRNPLFDFMFVMQNLYNGETNIRKEEKSIVEIKEISNSEPKVSDYENSIAKFDMTLVAWESADNLYCTLQYCTRLFKKETIQRFVCYFNKIIADVLEEPGKFISDIEIITGEEKYQLLVAFNNTQAQYPKNRTIHELFEEQVKRTPDHVAVVSQSVQDKTYSPEERHTPSTMRCAITYKELNKESQQLAHLLREKGVLANTIVGIMIERSIEMIIGIIAILKAGGAYLPIDPDYPDERIDHMLSDSKAKVLLTTTGLSEKYEKLSIVNCQLLMVNDIPPNCQRLNNPPKGANSINNYQLIINNLQLEQTSLAYIIYTSGSTGFPKGVLIQHQGVVNMVWFHRYVFGETPWSRISQVASASFDAMAFEVWPCLLAGAALCIVDNETRMDPKRMREWLIDHQITISFLPTLMAQQLLEDQWPETGIALEALRTAGDRLTSYPTRPYPFRFYNLYGPTEDTVWSTWTEVPVNMNLSARTKLPAIGKPIANKRVYILNRNLKLQPVGVVGELSISGAGLACGYLNNPELTAEKFDHDLWDYQDYHDEKKNYKLQITKKAAHELREKNNKKFLQGGPGGTVFSKRVPPGRRRQKTYKTGDLGRWLPDGNIEFLGRIDNQVKLRGYRIELGEIENQLLNHPGIKESVVLAGRRGDKDQYLCAYIVPIDTEMLDKPGSISIELKEYLTHSLPDYMIPSNFIVMKKIPLTRSGKIDRNALPLPVIRAGEAYVAPRSEIEETLVEIWSEVLEIEKDNIGIDDNFFELGGHSMKAAIMISIVQTRLDVTIPLVELFKTPTIKHLSGYILSVSIQTGVEFIKDKNLALLKKGTDSKNHLFLVHDGSGEVDGYIEFCNHLETGFNCWGLKADRLKNYSPKNLTIEEIAEKYLKRMMNIQSKGPYFIAGWSLGGVIAFEMARQLEQGKENYCFLALMDAPPPFREPLNNRNQFTFTCESELEMVHSYFKNKEIKDKLKGVTDVYQVWAQVVDYLKENKRDIDELEKIKEIIPANIAQVMPKMAHWDIGEFIYYLNITRTLDNALRIYKPEGKINNTAHYFGGTQSKIKNQKHWSDYFQKSLTFHKIVGDHFSIFKIPGVIKFAKTFKRILDDFL